MTHLFATPILASPIAILIALAGLIEVLRRLVESLRSLDRALPESFWPAIARAVNRARARVIEAITPPRPSPTVNKAAHVVSAAVFYALALQCTCLLVVDGLLVATRDASPWRKLLGAGVLLLIVLAGRFCFAQAETLRFKLRADSRHLGIHRPDREPHSTAPRKRTER